MSEDQTVPYRLVLPLDRGGRYEVWRIEPVQDVLVATDAAVVQVPLAFAGPPLALKCVPSGAAEARRLGEALRWEVHVQRRVTHPGIVPVELVEWDRQPAAVTPLGTGTVASMQVENSPGALRAIAATLRCLADALACLHAEGIVHGDVAPSNVVCFDRADADGAAFSPTADARTWAALSDFGCAADRSQPGDDGGSAHPCSAPLFGTPGSAAPEVVAGAAPGPAADVYGLGTVGQAWLAACVPALAPAASAALDAWCAQLTQPEPKRRPTAVEAAALLPVMESARTMEFGRRPPRPEMPVHPAHRFGLRSLRSGVIVGALVAGTIAVVAARHGGGGIRPAAHTIRLDPICAPPSPPALLRRGRPRRFDVFGTGCPQQLTWSGTVLTVRTATGGDERRYRLGQPGDSVAIADWSCGGLPRPALYRPALGEVLVYPALPTRPGVAGAAHPSRQVGLAVGGQAHIDRDARGCLHLRVTGAAIG